LLLVVEKELWPARIYQPCKLLRNFVELYGNKL
jgi:hypothetical protein